VTELRIEWLRDVGALDSIADEWRALEAEVHTRTHLSTYDFLGTWYRHYAGEYGGAPLIGLARQAGRLVGIAPMTIRRGRIGRIPVRRVEFAPSDVPAGEFLVEDGHPEIVAAFVESLSRSAKFDLICLDGVDPASDQLRILTGAACAQRMTVREEDHAFAVVDLHEGYEAYRKRLSGKCRRKHSQKAHRIEAEGIALDGVVAGERSAHIESLIDRLIAINEASYKLEGRPLATIHRDFLADVVRRLAARDKLSLLLLTIGGRDAAFILGVVERSCFYDITLAYDEAFARLSPGTCLMQKALEALAGVGIHTVVSHGAHEYKKHWSTAFVSQKRLFLFAPGPRASATRFVRFGLEPLWRRFGALRAEHATP
jgi:CelD/BcsL family acetyltransferase involved in cellulose biosynthesis